MEYAIGNSTVAFSWSEYFSTFLADSRSTSRLVETDAYSCYLAATRNAAGETIEDNKLAAHQFCWPFGTQRHDWAIFRIILDVPALPLTLP